MKNNILYSAYIFISLQPHCVILIEWRENKKKYGGINTWIIICDIVFTCMVFDMGLITTSCLCLIAVFIGHSGKISTITIWQRIIAKLVWVFLNFVLKINLWWLSHWLNPLYVINTEIFIVWLLNTLKFTMIYFAI